jgi:serine phosphatase RsbU (regulator of sigma subunit)
VLVLYTDGVIEARRDGDFYGEDRLVEFVKKLQYFSPKGLPKKIFDDVLKFSNGVTSDDIALLAVSPAIIADGNDHSIQGTV